MMEGGAFLLPEWFRRIHDGVLLWETRLKEYSRGAGITGYKAFHRGRTHGLRYLIESEKFQSGICSGEYRLRRANRPRFSSGWRKTKCLRNGRNPIVPAAYARNRLGIRRRKNCPLEGSGHGAVFCRFGGRWFGSFPSLRQFLPIRPDRAGWSRLKPKKNEASIDRGWSPFRKR